MRLADLLVKVAIATPHVGTRLSGYAARMQPSTGVLGGLDAPALVASDGRRTCGLPVRDLIELTCGIVNEVRRKVSPATGIAGDDLKEGQHGRRPPVWRIGRRSLTTFARQRRDGHGT